MARGEHFRLIRENVNEWNAWRREHPNLRPDLESADLHGLTLRGGVLARTNLDWADLSRADLTGASFAGAKLYGAHLEHARLDKADFAEAHLDGAFLPSLLCATQTFKARRRLALTCPTST